MAHDVFISYALEDQRVADAVCRALEERGIQCWYAPRNIPYAVDYEEAIVDAISQSKLMLLVLSAHANASAHVKREVQNACREEPQIPVLPFQIENVPLSKSFRYYLGSVHWLSALTPPLEDHLQKLVEYVRARLPQRERDGDTAAQSGQPAQTGVVEKDEEEALRHAEEALRLAEEAKRREVEEEERLAAEAEAQRKAEEERERSEAEERQRLEAEEAAKRQAEEERVRAEAGARKRAEQEVERLRAEAEQEEERRRIEEEKQARAEEERLRRKTEEAERQRSASQALQASREEKQSTPPAPSAVPTTPNSSPTAQRYDIYAPAGVTRVTPLRELKSRRVIPLVILASVVLAVIALIWLRQTPEGGQTANQNAMPTRSQATFTTNTAEGPPPPAATPQPSRRAQGPQSPIPQPNPPTPLVDYADVIDATTEQRLNNILMNLSEDKTANVEIGIVTVKTTNGQDIFYFSLAVMRGWGIGSTEKGGLLLVVAVDDRKFFTQVSRGLEADLPDSLVGRIQRERLMPQLEQGNYSQGISDTVEAYLVTLAKKRGFSLQAIERRRA